MAAYVAIFTAILASIGAIVSYQGGATHNEAILFKTGRAEKNPGLGSVNFYQAKA